MSNELTYDTLPPVAQEIIEAYLAMVDAEAPGLIEGFYLVGSISLGDFRSHRSDIDFIGVSRDLPGDAALEVLDEVHTRIHTKWSLPFFDGVYATWDDLAADPTRIGPRPCNHEEHFDPAGDSTDPVAWHTLHQSGVRCRGPERANIQIWHDRDVLAAWTDNNLESYWQRRVLDRSSRLLTSNGLMGLSEWSCEWCVTGVSRLHYTLATGAITSKDGAGVYALETFPDRWHRVIEESLRIRRAAAGRSLYRSRLSRRRDVRAFTQMAIADAHRLYAEQYPSSE